MSAARDVAYRCVMAVGDDDAYANLVMPGLIDQARLDGRDAAFATELAYGALRMRGQYDAIIAKAARRDPESLDPEVRSALWIGAHQVLAMRVPSHAAVSETVDLVRRERGQGAAKFANAVMRRVTEKTADAWLTVIAPGTSRAAKAVRFSHPEWVVGEFERALAADGRAGEIDALLEADNAPARVTLAARPGLADRDEVVAETGGEPGRWSPWAVTLASGRPGDLASVTEGSAAVQDEGSQVAAGALALARDVEPGERWLDMCAGPGGKAALLGAIAAQHGVELDALELHPHRADLVRASVRAVPDGTVAVHVGDAREWGDEGTYQRIVLDAPCSGLGALRRRPESRWRRDLDDLDDLVALQRALLARAERLLAPGGILAYITCSPVVAETREVVSGSTLRQLDARDAVAALTGTSAPEWGAGPHVQLWPHAHGTDAMFLALLERPA
ncbi:RsmB/NOP family class I SAM-dependent RNA methyltransferase [Demequina muriae]|uniref:Transcription antitermination factor NusB n=1 Tax=Demequina muriae TaxID=3051664 RepID=A0ABT8GJV0_9MICO|nr:transcription antitermination factor NusB [Demequina sp. EGI L300058]MDN4481702.1 transcription antitermination factor NusB [Demequina sp. EGI L300058]